MAAENERVLLPKNVSPQRYNIHVKTNFASEDFTFDGECSVELKVVETTSEITFHSLDIKYKTILVKVGDKSTDVTSTITFDKKVETCTVKCPEMEKGSEATLVCSYVAEMNDKMKGFYRCKYKNTAGETVYGGCTQFESTDARRAFPCWDEPNVKSVFDVTVTTDEHFVVLGNMPEKSRDENKEQKTVTVAFEASPFMSSYLVAWLVGEFDYVESKTKNGVLVRTYTPKGQAEKGQFACDFGVKCLDWYEDYFQIKFPLPKCDMVAVADFAAGAMENWGLVTYRESRVLVDKDTSEQTKQFVAQVVAHELAHQWFGNLVTMDWWKELWLNEGFANFMESYCSDQLSTLNYENFFVEKSLVRALQMDAMLTSHPIEVEVSSSAQVDEIFDAISYCKGGSVVRMVNKFLGAETFKKGLRIYMDRHKYSNTVTTDLWKALSEASGTDVVSLMRNWTKEQGYPLLEVSLTKDRKLKVSQSRFLSDGKPKPEQDTVIWNVPIVALTPQGEKKFLLKERETIFDDIEVKDWILLNHGLAGLFRVNYSTELLQALSKALSAGQIKEELDRTALISDIYALAKAGYCSCTSVLELLPSFKDEECKTPWRNVMGCLSGIRNLVQGEAEEEHLNKLTRDLLSNIVDKLGWDEQENESAETKMLRADVISVSAKAGLEKVIAEGKVRFTKIFSAEGLDCSGTMKEPVYRIGVRNGGLQEYETVEKRYCETENAQEKRTLCSAMAQTKNPEFHKRLLEFNMTDKVRKQDKVFALLYLGMNSIATRPAWEYVQENWVKLYSLFGGGFLVNYLARVPDRLTSLEDADQVEEFFKGVRETSPAACRAMDQTIEAIRLTGKWRKRDLGVLQKWLVENVSM